MLRPNVPGTGPLTVAGVSAVEGERVSGSSRSMLAPTVADGMVNACYVEAEQNYRDAVEETLVTWFGSASDNTTTPLIPVGRFEIDVQEAARGGLLPWAILGMGGVTMLGAASLWWSRRHEFALYGLLGFRSGQVLWLLTLEWGVVVLAPAIMGGLGAVSVTGLAGIDAALFPITVVSVAAYYLTILTVPAIGFLVVHSTPPVDLLKGA